MKREPKSNVVMVCKDCAPKSTEAWKDVKPAFLVGCFVKKGFAAIAPNGKPSRESMWVKITDTYRKKLKGTLANQPVFDMDIKMGDTIYVSMKEVIEVLGPTGATLKPTAIKGLEKLNLKGAPRGRKSRVQTHRA